MQPAQGTYGMPVTMPVTMGQSPAPMQAPAMYKPAYAMGQTTPPMQAQMSNGVMPSADRECRRPFPRATILHEGGETASCRGCVRVHAARASISPDVITVAIALMAVALASAHATSA